MEHLHGFTASSPQNFKSDPIRRTANVICLGLILMVLLDFSISNSLYFIADFFISKLQVTSDSVLSSIYIFCEITVSVLALVIPILLMRMFIGIPAWAAFPMRAPRASLAIPAVPVCLGVSVAGAFITSTILIIVKVLFGTTPAMPMFLQPVGIFASALYAVRIAAVPAIFEELMFRGVIMQSLRRFGDPFALCCSSLLFALAHRNLTQGPNAFITGLAIGFFVLRTGSLKTGMLIHFVNNAMTIVIDRVTENLPAGELEIAVLVIFAVYLAIGVAGLVFIAVKHGNIFYLAPSDYPASEKYKYYYFFISLAPLLYVALILFFMIRGFYH